MSDNAASPLVGILLVPGVLAGLAGVAVGMAWYGTATTFGLLAIVTGMHTATEGLGNHLAEVRQLLRIANEQRGTPAMPR